MFFPFWKYVFLLHVVYGFVSVPTHRTTGPCRKLSQALDKDRCYCEKPFHFPSLNDLVFYYGDRPHWWGDLDARQTRSLYHKLLPVYCPSYTADYSMETLSLMAYQTRKAAKQYARRRSILPVRWFSAALDIAHNLYEYKRWSPLGATYEELWQKYKDQLHPNATDHHIAATIVSKSCRTNEWVDLLCSDE